MATFDARRHAITSRARRSVSVLSALILGLAPAAPASGGATFDVAGWRRDFQHLKQEMAQRYANLDWIVSHRGLDLAALDAETGAAIERARSDGQAAAALRRFIGAFEDPHLKLVRGDRSSPPGTAGPAAVPRLPDPPAAVASCEAAGYRSGNPRFRFPFNRLPGWAPLRDGPFATGVAGDLGVLRIAALGEDSYLAACREAFRPGMTARGLRMAVRARLQQSLMEAIDDLEARGARRLLVDLTGNGGGTEWVTEVVALMTDQTLVRPAGRLVDPACDRSAIWRGEPVCPVLAPAGEPLRLTGNGHWVGPLFILVDHETGSASEDFVAWLQQNRVALVLGARTAGAGCGYVNGGGRIRLQAGSLDVMAPNCARFLNDGTNEIEGITPDVEIAMDGANRAVALAAALSAASARPVPPLTSTPAA